MQVNTKCIGTVDIDEDMIIEFPEGVPGFENSKKFAIIDTSEGQHPFRWLQCVDVPALSFVVVNPFEILNEYDINVNKQVITKLGIEDETDAEIFSIVVVPEDISKMTMNLKAPVIINTKNNVGMQVILDTDKYSVRHYVLEEFRGQGVTQSACTNKEER